MHTDFEIHLHPVEVFLRMHTRLGDFPSQYGDTCTASDWARPTRSGTNSCHSIHPLIGPTQLGTNSCHSIHPLIGPTRSGTNSGYSIVFYRSDPAQSGQRPKSHSL